MRNKFYLFDFDNTLVNTEELFPYRKTQNGRDFVAKHSDYVPSYDIDNKMNELINALNKQKQCAIITNSSLNYTKALLEKHGFNTDIPIVSNAKKPNTRKLKQLLNEKQVNSQDTIFVGDSATDILTAQQLQMASIGFEKGYSSPFDLNRAGANYIVSNSEDLEDKLFDFKEDIFGFKARRIPKNRVELKPSETLFLEDPQIGIHSLQDYIPYNYNKDWFYKSGTDKILSFKRAKDFFINKINNISDDYYFNGIRKGNKFENVISSYISLIENLIENLNLNGNTILLALPNSNPEFCYRTDINHYLTKEINKNVNSKFNLNKRMIYRTNPITSLHNGGNRDSSLQYKTLALGLTTNEFIKPEIKNIILFDDVTTTGTSLKVAGELIREKGKFNGNLYGVTLGKTIDRFGF